MCHRYTVQIPSAPKSVAYTTGYRCFGTLCLLPLAIPAIPHRPMMPENLRFVTTPGTLGTSLAILAIGTLLAAWGWHRAKDNPSVAWLEILRILILVGVAVTMNQPEWVETFLPEHRPAVAVLVDQSNSMSTADIPQEAGKHQTRAAYLKDLVGATDWEPLRAKTDVHFHKFASNLKDPAEGTDIHSAIENALEQHPNLRSLILLSDGDWNTGPPPSRAAGNLRSRRVPAYVLPVGSDSPLPDLRITSFDAPTFGVAGKPVRIPFSIESTLPTDLDTTLVLQVTEEEKYDIPVSIPAMGRLQTAFTWRPQALGKTPLFLDLPLQPSEVDERNNKMEGAITIRKEQLKVLLIETFPRWEYRYLRNALERDPGVEVHCLLFHPDFQALGGGRGYLEDFPDDKDLISYDVVFLGDVGTDSGQLTKDQCDRIKRLVRDQASGLVFLPGMRGYHQTLLDSSLEELYPVQPDPNNPYGIGSQTPGRISLTESGHKSLLTKLEDDPADNRETWRNLPGFQWHAAVTRAKYGTEVLARHDTSQTAYGRIPILVTRTFGTGKILFMGTDGAWRWRKGVEDLYHYRFWGQVARWMAYQRNMSEGKNLRLFHSPDTPSMGDTITLHANVATEFGEPVQDGTATVQISSPTGKTQTLRLLPAGEESWGLFSGNFTPQEPGEYQCLLSSDATPQTLELSIDIRTTTLEQIGRPARPGPLQEIAQISHGKLLQPHQLQEALQEIQKLPEPPPIEKRHRIWCHPAWGGLLFLLCGIFWTGRKMAGQF